MSKKDTQAPAEAAPKKKKGPTKAHKDALAEVEKKKKALKNANERKREAEEALDDHLAGRALRFGAGLGGGLLAGAITEGLRGSQMGAGKPDDPATEEDEGGFFDTDLKAALVPAGVGLVLGLFGGGNPVADAAAIGMAATLSSELGKAGVRKLREEDEDDE